MQNELVEVNRDCYRLYLFLKMFWLKKKIYWQVNVVVGSHFISIISCLKISLQISFNLVSYVVSPNYTCNSKLSEKLSYYKPLLLSVWALWSISLNASHSIFSYLMKLMTADQETCLLPPPPLPIQILMCQIFKPDPVKFPSDAMCLLSSPSSH